MGSKQQLQLSIIPSYFCNYNCEYCYLGKLRSERTLLPLNTLLNRMQELEQEHFIDHITVYGGEISLLSKEYIQELYNFIQSYKVTFVTNLSNDWLVDFCKEKNIHLSISLNEERQYYDKTLTKLLEMEKTSNMDLSIVVLPSILKTPVSELLSLYEKIGLDVFFIQYHPSILSKVNYQITEDEYSNFLYNIIKETKEHSYNINIGNIEIFKDNDYKPTADNFIFINPNGKFSSVKYVNGVEQPIEFSTLKDWKEFCNAEKKWYFDNCQFCEYYNKCKAEHLVQLDKKECSGLYTLLKKINTFI